MKHAADGAAGKAAGFSLGRHILGLAPLFALAVCLLLMFGNEDAIAAFFRNARGAGVTQSVTLWLTRNGGIPFYFAFMVIAIGCPERGGRDGLRFVAAYAVILVLLLMATDTCKLWIGRPRPLEAGGHALLSLNRAYHSFPSNHVVEATYTVMALAHYCAKRPVTLFCGIWLAGMGLARMYLGRHHPTDIIGSMVLGSLGVYFLFWIAPPHRRAASDAGSAALPERSRDNSPG